MTRPGMARGWFAACCVATLLAVVCALAVGKPDSARAAPTPDSNRSIPTPPSSKPTPDKTDDVCQYTECKPSKSPTTPGPNKSTADSSKETEEQDKPQEGGGSSDSGGGDDSGKPPDYFGQLTEQGNCTDRPHVTAPESAGKVSGDCIPVDSFGAFTTTGSGGSNEDCSATGLFCLGQRTNAGSDNGVDKALESQFNFVWAADLLVVNIAGWFTNWAVSFNILDRMASFAGQLRAVWDDKVITGLGLGGLGGLLLGIAVLWACLLMLFHRFRRGFAELAISLVIAAIGAAFLMHPGQTISGVMNTARNFGLTIASTTLAPGQSAPSSDAEAERASEAQVNKAVSDKLISTLVVKPHMIANTGQVQKGDCAKRYWEVIASEGDSRVDAGKRFMDAKCTSDSAVQPSVQRILVAMLFLIMTIMIGVFCLLAAGLLLLSQVAAVAYLAISGVVWALAPLQGVGRSLLTKWLIGLLVAIAGVILSLLIVVVYLDVLGLILGFGQSPLANFAIALIVIFVGFKLRKRLTEGFRMKARQLSERLEGTLQRPGGETLVEREQRRHTSVSRLQTATAVALGAGAGTLAGHKLGNPGEGDGSGQKKAVGFGERIRNAMGHTPHGRLAMDVASGNGRPGVGAVLPGAVGAGRGTANISASGPQAAQRAAHRTATGLADAANPSGSLASGERANRTASRVSGGGGGSSARAKELVAEMQRRQREREQEMGRRRLT